MRKTLVLNNANWRFRKTTRSVNLHKTDHKNSFLPYYLKVKQLEIAA